jgi:hypothetical protein
MRCADELASLDIAGWATTTHRIDRRAVIDFGEAGCGNANVTPDPATAMLDRFASLRQHQSDGRRSPHKPLLVLLALGRLTSTGRSDLPWSEAESLLADLVAEFGPPSRTGRRQSAAYPFTRLRSDYVWVRLTTGCGT